ncbi:MAG: septum formation initiator family protein [Bacteroidia bacterium]
MKKPEFINRIAAKYPVLRNRYIVAVSVFLVWVMFLDQNSLISQYQQNKELMKLKKEKRYYQVEIKKTKAQLDELFTDLHSLEKFARERYLMKKENEELWIFSDSLVQKP